MPRSPLQATDECAECRLRGWCLCCSLTRCCVSRCRRTRGFRLLGNRLRGHGVHCGRCRNSCDDEPTIGSEGGLKVGSLGSPSQWQQCLRVCGVKGCDAGGELVSCLTMRCLCAFCMCDRLCGHFLALYILDAAAGNVGGSRWIYEHCFLLDLHGHAIPLWLVSHSGRRRMHFERLSSGCPHCVSGDCISTLGPRAPLLGYDRGRHRRRPHCCECHDGVGSEELHKWAGAGVRASLGGSWCYDWCKRSWLFAKLGFGRRWRYAAGRLYWLGC
mmetsp:Transcript_84078/g.271035  ORF Transcript_84078/g.271035 Transcript_84078/m.271035 type:complete len:272 (+) Transcript_84078:107-922(+)